MYYNCHGIYFLTNLDDFGFARSLRLHWTAGPSAVSPMGKEFLPSTSTAFTLACSSSPAKDVEKHVQSRGWTHVVGVRLCSVLPSSALLVWINSAEPLPRERRAERESPLALCSADLPMKVCLILFFFFGPLLSRVDRERGLEGPCITASYPQQKGESEARPL